MALHVMCRGRTLTQEEMQLCEDIILQVVRGELKWHTAEKMVEARLKGVEYKETGSLR